MLGNVLVVLVLAVIVFFAMRSSMKHMRGEGDCCGGGGDVIPRPRKHKKQRLQQVVAVKKLTIAGMTCVRCQANVENALNSVDQVNATVNLLQEEAIVKLGTDVADDVLRNAVEEAGYKVVAIENM